MSAPPRAVKVLALGMDAAEPSLLREWACAGYLPNLQRLIATGWSTDLTSPALQFPDAVWPTLYTSRGPATLGQYYFIRPKPGTARLELLDDDFTAANAGEPFWVTASQHGRRCIVVDLPKIALGPPINGIQLACWGAHASHASLAAHPRAFLERLASAYGRYPLHNCDWHGGRAADYARFREGVLACVVARL